VLREDRRPRAEIAYDTAGRAYLFTNYDAWTGGNIVNQVQREFNGLGQLTKEYQSHSGAVNTGTTPNVQYAYSEMTGGANHSRLTSMTYPNGKVVDYNYTASIDAAISRLTSMSDSTGTLEGFDYLGLGTVVRRSHPEPDVDLTYIKQGMESNGDAGDQYTGLDRFGRVVDQRWIDTTDGSHTDRFKYGYDRNLDDRPHPDRGRQSAKLPVRLARRPGAWLLRGGAAPPGRHRAPGGIRLLRRRRGQWPTPAISRRPLSKTLRATPSIWHKDGDGFLHYTSYDMGTSAVTKTIDDVDTMQTGDFADLPLGWTTPSVGGLHLETLIEVDGLGRSTKVTAPAANLVKRAERWRWSSLWRRQHGDAAARAVLAPWPIPEPADWLELVNSFIPRPGVRRFNSSRRATPGRRTGPGRRRGWWRCRIRSRCG
jgi:hypothetical protein